MKVLTGIVSRHELEARLEYFESVFAMTTGDFVAQYRDGLLPDRAEYAEWEEVHATMTRLFSGHPPPLR